MQPATKSQAADSNSDLKPYITDPSTDKPWNCTTYAAGHGARNNQCEHGRAGMHKSVELEQKQISFFEIVIWSSAQLRLDLPLACSVFVNMMH